ncbi:MAG: MBL fold metallo-hydrolase [Balneolaceae bacterium]|nr:MAG: MBL fold metallo-hydrolase [Balneolaceae bacterium]
MQNSQVKAAALYEGTFSVGADHKFNRIQRDAQPQKGTLKLSINPFLINDGNRNILFDAGLGDLIGDDTSIHTLINNLAEHSVAEYEVTDIFISHLHLDHFAGIAHRENGYWELTFPDAVIYVSEQGWKKLAESIANEGDDAYNFYHFIDAKANLHFLNEDAVPIPNVRVKRIGGHTEFHQAMFFDNGHQRYLMAGDVIGRRIAMNRSFVAKFDYEPEKSKIMRDDLKKMAYQNQFTIMAYHETDHPMFILTEFSEKAGYTIKPVTG